MTVLIVITSVAAILTFILQLFGWLKIEPKGVKKFIAIRGRLFAWNFYLVIATLFTIFYVYVILLLLFYSHFSIALATAMLLILWATLGIWTPAIGRLGSKRINTAVNITALCLLTLTVIGFWLFKWPEIQQPIFVTLLLLAIPAIYIFDMAMKKRKLNRN